jgi:DNA-directed RNA polymerase specialized sigma24 family protein
MYETSELQQARRIQLFDLIGEALKCERVRRICRMTGYEPDDFKSELYLKIEPRFNSSVHCPKTYVRTSAINYLKSFFSRQGVYGCGSRSAFAKATPIDGFEIEEDRRRALHIAAPNGDEESLQTLVNELRPQLREAIQAMAGIHPDGLACSDLAKKYSRSRQQVHNWVKQARALLKVRFKGGIQ